MCAYDVAEWYELEKKRYGLAVAKYNKSVSDLEHKFLEDAIADVGLKGHEAAERAFNYAWDQGHSCGLSEVYSCLLSIAYVILGENHE